MAKIIDVTLATMQDVGPFNVSPKGKIRCSTVRDVNDEEVHQVDLLYLRLESEQPMHPMGQHTFHQVRVCHSTSQNDLQLIQMKC